MKKLIFIVFILFSFNITYSQGNGLKNYYATLNYSKVYKVDLDINKWYFQNYFNSSIIIDLGEDGSGRIINYFQEKNVYFVKRNYKVEYTDGSSTFFFELDNGNILRLGVTSENITSAFSFVLKDNTTITLCN